MRMSEFLAKQEATTVDQLEAALITLARAAAQHDEYRAAIASQQSLSNIEPVYDPMVAAVAAWQGWPPKATAPTLTVDRPMTWLEEGGR